MSAWKPIVSCEHASNRVPAEYTSLFASRAAQSALGTHRGYDIGAIAVCRSLARALDVRPHEGRVSRLVTDLNRSPHHPRVFSEFMSKLGATARREALAKHHAPHRARIEEEARRYVAARRAVFHVGVHSFTPQLGAQVRTADVALLYDPGRDAERELCDRWKRAIEREAPELRVRRNYPYRGVSDGLTTHLRKALGSRYVGIELELNQALLTTDERRRTRLVAALNRSLTAVLKR